MNSPTLEISSWDQCSSSPKCPTPRLEQNLTHIRKLDRLVFRDGLGDFVNLVGHILWCGSTVGSVELDAEIVFWSTGVVTRGEQDSSIGLHAPNESRSSRGREDRVFAQDKVLDTVSGTESQDDLYDFRRVESPITTDNERLALASTGHGGECCLDKVFGIVLLLEYLDLLSKARGTGLLARERLGGDGDDVGPVVRMMTGEEDHDRSEEAGTGEEDSMQGRTRLAALT